MIPTKTTGTLLSGLCAGLLLGACGSSGPTPEPLAPGAGETVPAAPHDPTHIEPTPPPPVELVEPDEPDEPEPTLPPIAADEYATAVSGAGGYTVRWRTLSGEDVPNNEHFELDVLLYRGTEELEPLSGAKLYVSAWMPDHGHGLVVAPKSFESEEQPGRYLVKGMLFHMGGFWELFFDVVDEGGISERAAFEIDLP